MKMSKTQQSIFSSILLAVDGSRSAKAAARAAARIAFAMDWKIHALYVVDATQVFEMYTDTTKELSELGEDLPNEEKITLFEEQGTLALAEIEELYQQMDVPLTTEMIFGGIPETLLEAAKAYCMLAIGRRGNRHEKDKNHLGSNFLKVAHHIHIPLLIGGRDSTQTNFKRALLAYDGSELSRKALTWTENLQGMLSEVTTLSVQEDNTKDCAWLPDRYEKMATNTLAHYEFIRKEGEPGQTIASTAASKQAELILMGAYHHSSIFQWARHSAIDTVLRKVDLPVLAAK